MDTKKFEEMTETEKQEFLSNTMAECRKAYVEEPLATDDLSLKKFLEAIKHKGFNFDPFSFIKLLDAEAERQHKAIFADLFSGIKPDRLADIKNEVIKWYNDEEVRFQTFKENFINTSKGPAQMDIGSTPTFVHEDAHAELPEPMAEVTPIKSAKPKSKSKGNK